MFYDNKIWIAKSGEKNIYIEPKMANRHGLIAGATGTGKTVTLKVMAEAFSDAGVPVFLADIKGDISGMCLPGDDSQDMQERIARFGLADAGFSYKAYPVTFWDVYGDKGIPLRTTISEMGPILLSRILGLNATQSSILSVVFKIADDQSLLLIDTKDLRSMLAYVGENSKELSVEYGNMSKQSLNTIIRSVIALEEEGGEWFFGEPALDIHDWMTCDADGRGTIQILDCQKLVNNPTMYSTFLLWMLSELYETLPEAGDLDKPKLVFFFDEAHLLFETASKDLLSKIEQIVKLVRSKGVGVYFVTQVPRDIPDGILSQLGNKVQHALHAYTPADQKAVKAASQSFRENPEFNTYETLLNLGIGEALISVLDEKGIPTVVENSKILPPQSLMGPCNDRIRDKIMMENSIFEKYDAMIDRDSAYEFLQRKAIENEEAAQIAKEEAEAEKQAAKEAAAAEKQAAKEAAAAERQAAKEAAAAEKEAQKAAEKKQKAVKQATKNVASSTAGTLGREVGKAVGSSVGGKFGKTLGGNVGASLGRGIIGTLFGMK